jgi:hypothetical protein
MARVQAIMWPIGDLKFLLFNQRTGKQCMWEKTLTGLLKDII